jgi:SAM-dependent methyltransferase
MAPHRKGWPSGAYDRAVSDALFEDSRLVSLYDRFEGNRTDLEVYVKVAEQLGARRVADIGCGTGSFALLLAERGFDVIGVDPAAASLAVAQTKPRAGAVRWLHGDATALRPLEAVDLATMTGNVAQAIVDPVAWRLTLSAIYNVLRPGGFLVFETRDPADRAWEEWSREATRQVVQTDEADTVERWTDIIDVALPLVTFRTTFVFADNSVVTSDSTLRFRQREEVETDLSTHGYEVVDIRGAPDRPQREFVFFAQRPVK